jgi:hypothetical protein
MNASMCLFTLRLQPRHSLSGVVVMGRKAIWPTGFRWPVCHRADLPVSETAPWQSTAPTLHDLQPRDVFRELLHEKHIEGEELNAAFDELLAIREARVTD